MKDWPLEPITLIDNIPLKIVIGYELGGAPENGPDYLKYCLESARWTSRHYKPANKGEIDAALQKLLDSTHWKKPLDKWQFGLIHKQTLD